MSIMNKPPLNENHNLSNKVASVPQLKLVEAPNSASNVRRLVKAFFDDPAFHAAVRDAATPVEKHEIIRKAGYVPVYSGGIAG